MSKYTTEVRFICEASAGLMASEGQASVSKIISDSWEKIFDFDFPIFDPEYRSVLCTKILKHYYTREIGLETVGLWKLKLDTKMNEIMPYYNGLYESAYKKYDFLRDADYYREHTGEEQGNNKDKSNSSNSGNNYGLAAFSDTPQGALDNVENNTYLTNATKNTGNYQNSGNSSRNGSFDTTDHYLEHVYGKMPGKTYASLIKEYRATLINIDVMIIDELSDLFMKVW